MTFQDFYGQSHIELELLQNELEELRQQIENAKRLSDDELPEFSKKFLLYDLEKQYKAMMLRLEKEKEKIQSDFAIKS